MYDILEQLQILLGLMDYAEEVESYQHYTLSVKTLEDSHGYTIYDTTRQK